MALLCGRSWNLLPAAKFKAGACPACGQLPERVLHSWAQVSSQKAAEGLGRSCVPTFNSQLSGGTQDLVLLPQDSQWVPPGAQLPLLEAAQAEGHVPRPAVVRSDLDLPGTTLFLGFAHDTNRGGPSACGPRIRPHPQTGIARTPPPLPEAGARGQAACFLWENCGGGAPSLTPDRSQTLVLWLPSHIGTPQLRAATREIGTRAVTKLDTSK